MAARTGQEYLNGLQEQAREIYLDNQRVEDVTTFPGLANGAAEERKEKRKKRQERRKER
jgi:aromatic ring hydroxylase